MVANSQIVWKVNPFIREVVIEKVLAVLFCTPARGYRWVGVLNREKFRLIYYVNESKSSASKSFFAQTRLDGRRQNGLCKSISATSPALTKFGKSKQELQQGIAQGFARNAAQWRRVLKIRVPSGFGSEIQNLVAYGQGERGGGPHFAMAMNPDGVAGCGPPIALAHSESRLGGQSNSAFGCQGMA